MTDQTPQAGHNNPPSPLEEVQSSYDAVFEEVAHWADGTPIENDGQLKAVESLVEQVKSAKKDAESAKEIEYRPHKDACDEVTNRYKPFFADLDGQVKCLLKVINPYKQKLLEAQQEAERIAREAAERAEREAREAAAKQVEGSIDDLRSVSEKADEAQEAKNLHKKIAKQTIKGMRTKRIGVIVDGKALINHIATNDKPALIEFMEGYVKDHVRHNRGPIPGLRVDTTKESF